MMRTVSVALPSILAAIATRIDSKLESFRIVRAASGLTHPWSIAFLPGGSILVSEPPGGLLILSPQTGELKELSGAQKVAAIRSSSDRTEYCGP